MINRDNVISGGTSGLVELISPGSVRKSAYPESETRKQNLRDIECEFQIYQRLPRHDRLLRMIEYSPEDGLVLEYMPGGTLRRHLREATQVDWVQRLQWACDAAEALHILHSHGVIHCDMKPENILLDSKSRLKLIDFAGSSMDGAWSSAFESARFAFPRPIKDPSTIDTDLFALGSTIYEIMTGRQPYDDLSEDEVETRYAKQLFPDVESLPCREVMKQCWHCEMKSAHKAMTLIEEEMKVFREENKCTTIALVENA